MENQPKKPQEEKEFYKYAFPELIDKNGQEAAFTGSCTGGATGVGWVAALGGSLCGFGHN